MSTCISIHGEYSEHTPDEDCTCTLCGHLDEGTLIEQARRGRQALAAIERVRAVLAGHLSEDEGGAIGPHCQMCTVILALYDDDANAAVAALDGTGEADG